MSLDASDRKAEIRAYLSFHGDTRYEQCEAICTLLADATTDEIERAIERLAQSDEPLDCDEILQQIVDCITDEREESEEINSARIIQTDHVTAKLDEMRSDGTIIQFIERARQKGVFGKKANHLIRTAVSNALELSGTSDQPFTNLVNQQIDNLAKDFKGPGAGKFAS